MEELIEKIQQNPDAKLIIYGIIGILVLLLVLKLFKLPLKILLNGIFGVILLYIVNLIGTNYDVTIGINIVTALVAGFLGIPGVIALLLIQIFF